jgi:hypothetical protein
MSSCASALRVARALLAALFLVFTVGADRRGDRYFRG